MPFLLAADFKGLVTSAGTFARPVGSMEQAWNVEIPAPGVVRCRRGIERRTVSNLKSTHSMVSLPMLGNGFLVNHTQGASQDRAVALATVTTAGTFSAVAASGVTNKILGYRMHAVQMAKNAYLTSYEGVRRMFYNEMLYGAGMPRGLPLGSGWHYGATFNVLTGAPGTLLADGSSTAYRVTWHMRDEQGREIGGPPTGRAVVRNLDGETGWAVGVVKNVVCRVIIPKAVGTAATALSSAYFFRLWRARTSTGTPDDEMYQVNEHTLTAGEVTTGYVDVTDSTSDTILVSGPKLHTNANDYLPDYDTDVRGVANADEIPPQAVDVAQWADCLWMGNLREWGAQQLTMLAMPADGDTITVNGTAYTFKTVPAAATHVQIVTGFASNSDDIEHTCRALCDRINVDVATTKCYAFYIAAGQQLPGQMVFVAAEVGQLSTFTTTTAVSVAASWLLGSFVSSASTNDTGALAYSKPGLADAVPPAHRFAIGPTGNVILRIIPFRNQLLVFSSMGIYRVTGDSPANFSVDLFDGSFHIWSPASIATMDDAVYAWCAEGIIRIDQGGVRVVSGPIDSTVRSIMASTTAAALIGFAVADATNRRVMFFYPGTDAVNASSAVGKEGYESACPYAFCLNVDTQTWTQWRNDATYETADPLTFPQGYLCGAALESPFSNPIVYFGEGRVTDAACSLFYIRGVADSNPWREVDRAGTATAVRPVLVLNYLVPEAHSSTHWQELLLHWETNNALGYVAPAASQSVTFGDEWAQASYAGGYTLPLNASFYAFTRVHIPQDYRRLNRLRVRIARSAATQEAWGLVGISVRHEPGTKVVRK